MQGATNHTLKKSSAIVSMIAPNDIPYNETDQNRHFANYNTHFLTSFSDDITLSALRYSLQSKEKGEREEK